MTISFTAVILTCDYENAQIRLTFSGWTKSQPYVEDPRSKAPGSGGPVPAKQGIVPSANIHTRLT